MNSRGRLFVFEGADSVGKTTLSQALAKYLSEMGEPTDWFAFPGRRKNSLGALVYGIHHDPVSYGLERIAPLANQILHIAAHVDAIESMILPSLRAGRSVVLDRFWWSTIIYGPKEEPDKSALHKIVEAEKDIWSEIKPTAVFLIKREMPWDLDLQGSTWEGLQQDYLCLASSQSVGVQTLIIENERLLSDSLGHITSWISRLPKET